MALKPNVREGQLLQIRRDTREIDQRFVIALLLGLHNRTSMDELITQWTTAVSPLEFLTDAVYCLMQAASFPNELRLTSHEMVRQILSTDSLSARNGMQQPTNINASIIAQFHESTLLGALFRH